MSSPRSKEQNSINTTSDKAAWTFGLPVSIDSYMPKMSLRLTLDSSKITVSVLIFN